MIDKESVLKKPLKTMTVSEEVFKQILDGFVSTAVEDLTPYQYGYPDKNMIYTDGRDLICLRRKLVVLGLLEENYKLDGWYQIYCHMEIEQQEKIIDGERTSPAEAVKKSNNIIKNPEKIKEIVKKINSCDAYFSPYFNIPSKIKIPVYTTIHDVVFLDIPSLAGKCGTLIRKMFYKYAVKKSKEILKEVLMPSILVAIFDSLICYGLCRWLESNILDLVLLLIINSIALVLIIVLTGLNKAERNICMMFACKIKEKITKNIKYKSNED